ncbi:helix-turn-helix domain-containing protein [Chryseobacterium tongliaoense]|uniref:helix-turn-helix domain-containing protein n=1 Tax=Chryseobacterium tongliaoense TaxID=3240933 RepID=UPI0035159EB2
MGQVNIKNNSPDYKKIYTDILNKRFPEKIKECKDILNKEVLSHLDVININNLIFGNGTKEVSEFNQKHRFYNKSTILKILDYQKKNHLNNTQLAMHFKMSRNTVTKWKKIFLV